jgi:hypothetical protein
VSLRWYVCASLEFLKFHSPDCDDCSVQDCMGVAMRRLKELNEHAERVCQQKSHGTKATKHDAA